MKGAKNTKIDVSIHLPVLSSCHGSKMWTLIFKSGAHNLTSMSEAYIELDVIVPNCRRMFDKVDPLCPAIFDHFLHG